MELIEAAPLWALWLALFALLAGASLAGRFVRRRAIAVGRDTPDNVEVGYVVAASLGLLSLLVAFTFNVSLNRYETRRDLVVAEANAIRALALRAELLADADAARLIMLARAYTDSRVAFFDAGASRQAIRRAQADSERLQEAMWDVVLTPARGGDRSLQARAVADAFAPLVAIGGEREAAAIEHIPARVFLTLVVVAALTAAILGYAAGASAVRHWLPKGLFFGLLTTAIILVVDLDRPRGGGVEVSQQPILTLVGTLAAMARERAVAPAPMRPLADVEPAR